MQYRHIAIEGNIGSGKTVLARKLGRHYKAALLLLETFEDNPFLVPFYTNNALYALPLELSFLLDRHQQLQAALTSALSTGVPVISDYISVKSCIFAGINLGKEEYALFKRVADLLQSEQMLPDLLIYLHTPVSRLQQQIHQRGRSFEADIPDEYLLRIEDGYNRYLEKKQVNTLVINTSEINLQDEAAFSQLITFLEAKTGFRDKILHFNIK